MARAGDEMVDPNTGERMIFRKTAKETGGELLQLDWIGKAGWRPGRYRLLLLYSPKCLEKLSDNSRKASLWTPKRGQNRARGVVSSPLVASIAGVHGSSYDLSDSFRKWNSAKFICRILDKIT
jgi:hypothetical protein